MPKSAWAHPVSHVRKPEFGRHPNRIVAAKELFVNVVYTNLSTFTQEKWVTCQNIGLQPIYFGPRTNSIRPAVEKGNPRHSKAESRKSRRCGQTTQKAPWLARKPRGLEEAIRLLPSYSAGPCGNASARFSSFCAARLSRKLCVKYPATKMELTVGTTKNRYGT